MRPPSCRQGEARKKILTMYRTSPPLGLAAKEKAMNVLVVDDDRGFRATSGYAEKRLEEGWPLAVHAGTRVVCL